MTPQHVIFNLVLELNH